MRVGLTQMDIVWEDKEKNIVKAEILMAQAERQKWDLLV